MKLKVLTLIVSLTLTALQASAAELSCNSMPLNLHTVLPIEVSSAQVVSHNDIMIRCSTIVSDLQVTLSRANILARSGKMAQGAELLYTYLQKKSQTLPVVGFPEAPHTFEAIQSGVDVASALVRSTQAEWSSLGTSLVSQVRFTGMVEIYELILHAYRELDERYYLAQAMPCSRRARCVENASQVLPSEYYNGVLELANKFVRMQISMGPIQASDRVELEVSEAVARAAKSILMNSLFRRGLACQITSLHALETRIHRHLNCGDEYPSYWLVQEVRESLRGLHIEVPRCQY